MDSDRDKKRYILKKKKYEIDLHRLIKERGFSPNSQLVKRLKDTYIKDVNKMKLRHSKASDKNLQLIKQSAEKLNRRKKSSKMPNGKTKSMYLSEERKRKLLAEIERKDREKGIVVNRGDEIKIVHVNTWLGRERRKSNWW